MFNSFRLTVEQVRQYNTRSDVIYFTLDKLKILYDINNLADSETVNEKLLYLLNEKLRILFNKSGRTKPVLDQHVLMVSLIDSLIRISEIICKSEARLVSLSLIHI